MENEREEGLEMVGQGLLPEILTTQEKQRTFKEEKAQKRVTLDLRNNPANIDVSGGTQSQKNSRPNRTQHSNKSDGHGKSKGSSYYDIYEQDGLPELAKTKSGI